MIPRQIASEFKILLEEYPVITILGPRQAGKTTLARETLPDYEYYNLEIPEVRMLAEEDPKGFLAQFKRNVILDEIQRVPGLLSYIQSIVDMNQRNGQFVLTGSHQLALREAISQSLAGRSAILNLLPLSMRELSAAGTRFSKFEEYIYHGFLPRVYDQQQRPTQAYSNYYQTYVERDVRQLINLKDMSLFEKFMKLLAGRVGQLIDYSALANNVGVSAKTIKQWLSILEASFVVYKLAPYFENFGKRVVKAPKYYFLELGLLAFLLGIEDPDQIFRDPLVGNMFENLVVVEILKARFNQGKLANLYFYRDSNKNELDIVYQKGRALIAMEVKSSATYHPSLMKALKKVSDLSADFTQGYLIYAGDDFQFSNQLMAIRYDHIDTIFN